MEGTGDPKVGGGLSEPARQRGRGQAWPRGSRARRRGAALPRRQLAARPGASALRSGYENANRQLAGSAEQIGGDKTARQPAARSPGLGRLPDARAGGVRGGVCRAGSKFGAGSRAHPKRLTRGGAAGAARPSGQAQGRAGRSGRRRHQTPRGATVGRGARRTLGGEHAGPARAPPRPGPPVTTAAAAATWAPGTVPAERAPAAGHCQAPLQPLPALGLLAPSPAPGSAPGSAPPRCRPIRPFSPSSRPPDPGAGQGLRAQTHPAGRPRSPAQPPGSRVGLGGALGTL